MRCPICKREVNEGERERAGGVYPFCSERCKLIDLGRWLGEKYQVPVIDEDESMGTTAPPEGDKPRG